MPPSYFRAAAFKRMVLRGTPEAPVRVLVAFGTVMIGEALAVAQRDAAAGKGVIVVGITRYAHWPQACWQVCLARQGDPLRWVSAHHHKRDAEAQIERVCLAASQGDLRDDTSVAALVERLAARGDQHLKETLGAAPELRIDAAVG